MYSYHHQLVVVPSSEQIVGNYQLNEIGNLPSLNVF